jgi:hypothetical protein
LLNLFRHRVETVAMTDHSQTGERDPNRPGQARDAQSSLAASDSIDPDRVLPGEGDYQPLLPGEEPSSQHVDDVEHWLTVYSELLDFKRFMLDGARLRANEMRTETARNEVERTDLRVARAEAERFAARLAYWRGRRDAIKKAQAPI